MRAPPFISQTSSRQKPRLGRQKNARKTAVFRENAAYTNEYFRTATQHFRL